MVQDVYGRSSPSSPLISSESIVKDANTLEKLLNDPRISASSIVEFISSRRRTSSAVYIYDLAEQVGFGPLTKAWAKSNSETAHTIDLQTRAGAGLSLVGRLSEGTSSDTVNGAVLTAYTSPHGLGLMGPALAHLPPATPSSRLVLQVPTVTPVGETFTLSPSLASLASTYSTLPNDITVLLSATSHQAVHFTQIAYKLSTSHTIHLFDHSSTTREIGHEVTPLAEKQLESGDLGNVLKSAGYSYFDYSGDSNAHTVIVLLNGPLALASKAIASHTSGLGVVSVNVLRPWNEEALRAVIPASARTIHVLDDVPNVATQGPLYADVFSTLLDSLATLSVKSHRVVPSQTQDFLSQENAFHQFLAKHVPHLTEHPAILPRSARKLVFFSSPASTLTPVSSLVQNTLLSSHGISARLLTDHDIFSKRGGITANRILLSPKKGGSEAPVPFTLPLDSRGEGVADFLAVLDPSLLKTHLLVNYARPGALVLVATSWTAEELLASLPASTAQLLTERRLFVVDPKAIANHFRGTDHKDDLVENIAVYFAFLRLYLGVAATEESVFAVAKNTIGDNLDGIDLGKVHAYVWDALEELDVPILPVDENPSKLKEFQFNAISVDTEEGDDVINGARLSSWHDAAKHIIFPSAYVPPAPETDEEFPQIPALRPEVPDRTYLVTCTVNRRLTPLEYDRNVFHLEFDTSGTGLKYAIGEALGVHGWNDEQDVLEFCSWYGVDPNRLITIPVPNGEGRVHTRTVLQALQQQIDLFGHPPKSFYTELAAHAASSPDKHALLFIGAAEGSATYKKLSEKDTVTFADVLRMYPSAKPGIETLCELVGDIKPRHYSIASAQSVVGDRVDLLVVTVEWANPSGSPRYGQCTRYLAGLKIGQKVTVSIKPSVMKLPPDDKQPLIMAGLGTGAAPFRAFLQHKAWLAQQGKEIGPVYYYFGSRHQSQEYLYGEEIEAFILDGIISRAGLAFSRDGARKVYIQHKMHEDSKELAEMLHQQNGVFYLCGPTWPVPDVFEALCRAMEKYVGLDMKEAGDYLESLKEEERYVLEVY
ncbi:sulfite reductase [NADPH] flavoprotein component [Marasmius tenuissimus]|uniref:Sulfite reductase [NADPH] flavoprotein component n=1 Tax=Marasmius tenuissimus TaxID=585030 RepID=A0ABR3ABZ4_9AGAR